MIKKILATQNSLSPLIARLALGIVILPHGVQKVTAFTATMSFFTETMGIPTLLALLVVLTEFLGALGLIFGLLSRVCALGIAVIMMVAIFMVHLPHGFFMNWQGNQSGEGFEFHLLAIGLALIVIIQGGGAFSIDKKLSARDA